MKLTKEKILKKSKPKTKYVVARVHEETKKWLAENGYTPSSVFNSALKAIGCPYIEKE